MIFVILPAPPSEPFPGLRRSRWVTIEVLLDSVGQYLQMLPADVKIREGRSVGIILILIAWIFRVRWVGEEGSKGSACLAVLFFCCNGL